MTRYPLDDFTRHYLIAALWASSESDERREAGHDLEDIATETVAQAYQDCLQFQAHNMHLLTWAYDFYDESGMSSHPDTGSAAACAGHDFWLTRAGAGVGFWDRGMGDLGDKLTTAAQAFRAIDFYVGDDGKIYSA